MKYSRKKSEKYERSVLPFSLLFPQEHLARMYVNLISIAYLETSYFLKCSYFQRYREYNENIESLCLCSLLKALIL